MRTIDARKITDTVAELCIKANHYLTPDMEKALENAAGEEKSPVGCTVLSQLKENLKIAGEDMIPICQYTGMTVVFLEIGQDVHIEGGDLTEAVNEGVRRGYVDGYLRKSVVSDPLLRENTKDNTPAILHTEIVSGEHEYERYEDPDGEESGFEPLAVENHGGGQYSWSTFYFQNGDLMADPEMEFTIVGGDY